jgi:hypothetical protein
MGNHIENFIKENNFQEVSILESNSANFFFKNNPDKLYGISSNMFFMKFGMKTFFKKLPFVFQDEIILTVEERRQKRKNDYANKELLLELYLGVHIFLRDDQMKSISNESQKRSWYKKQEHKACDDNNDNKRITTGTIAEKAVEIFTKTKTTDFSAPTQHSSDFQVADNQELNFGVKGSDEFNVYTIIETPAPHDEIICTNIKRYNRSGGHVSCRGFVRKENLNNRKYHSRNVITDNNLLAKSIFAQTKIGFIPQKEILIPFYSNNEINFNPNNNSHYIASNLAIDCDVDFRNLSPDFIKNFENHIKNNNSTILYVHMNSLGLQTLKQLPYFYERPKNKEQEDRIIALENFAMNYGVGVVFYDRFHKNAHITQYAPKNDKYLYGILYSNGYIKPLKRTEKGNKS